MIGRVVYLRLDACEWSPRFRSQSVWLVRSSGGGAVGRLPFFIGDQVVLLLLGLRQWSQLQQLGTLGRAVVIDETGEHWEKEDLTISRGNCGEASRTYASSRTVTPIEVALVGCPPDAWERHVSALTQTFLGEARKGKSVR